LLAGRQMTNGWDSARTGPPSTPHRQFVT
jgi:hypothetical protein